MTTEATRTTEQNEALIAEMLRDAKTVELDNDLTKNPVLHKGDEDLDSPMIIKEMQTAGYVYLWETKTFEKIPVLRYMAASKLREKRPDGSYRFTATKPQGKPWRGTTKCMLHPHEQKERGFEGLGFRQCSKSNLTNPYERDRHMKMKHPKEWEIIDNIRKDKERVEDREMQKAILERISASIPASDEEVKDKTDPIYLKRVEAMAKARAAKANKSQ